MQESNIPDLLAALTKGYTWRRITLGQSESRTYKLTGTSRNLYLKIQSLPAVESLLNEKERLVWLVGKLPVPEVLFYGSNDAEEYLLITEVPGVNASDQSFKGNLPLIKQVALGLQAIHALPIKECPFDQRLDSKITEAKRRVDEHLVDEDDFDEVRQGLKAADVFEELMRTKPATEDIVFTHGDYCLPNIIVNNGKFGGVIDWGRGGLADRYQDIALAIRSINYNFGAAYIPIFLETYGLKEVDESRIQYYQLMDEFF